MSTKNRILLVGWDAADWKVINQLVDQGKMPTLKRLIESGTCGNIRTLNPPLSPMLWTSIATGKRPFKHGIYGFTEPAPDGKSIQPMTNVSRKCKAIWNILTQQQLRSIVVGWWPSHPAEPICGVMVSDYFNKAPRDPSDPWRLPPNTVHPRNLTESISRLRVHPMELLPEEILAFVPEGAAINQEVDPRLSNLMKVIAECAMVHNVATHLVETEEWDFAAIYLDAIDHFSHGFMRYHPPQQPNIPDFDFRMFRHVVSTAYIYHDMMLGRLLELAGEDCTVFLVSDHGFHPDHLRPNALPSEPTGPASEHRDFGVLVANGPGIRQDHLTHGASLLDVTPTLLTMFGLPIGEDMDGQPLVDIFERPPNVKYVASWEAVEGHDGRHPKGMVMDPAESKAALEQLAALGYIEPVDDDSENAIAKTVRELDYNLARAWMDAGMHGEAIPLLEKLYGDSPLEFRFGVQLANCLRAAGRTVDLKRLVEHLNLNWRTASNEARRRMKDVVEVARERKKNWEEMKRIDEQNGIDPDNRTRLARVTAKGTPVLFNDNEIHEIRRLRAIGRGNPETLDFLAATVASAEGNFDKALELLQVAGITESTNPALQYQVGNVYLQAGRFVEAERAFKKGLEIDEFHPHCLMGLCRTSLKQAKNSDSLAYGKQAIGLMYHFPVAHYYLGEAKMVVGNFDGAIESLNTAIHQNPNFVEAHQLLARIYSHSHLDKSLMKAHEEMTERLTRENADTLVSSHPIRLPTLDAVTIKKNLPAIFSEAASNREFLPCLAHPPLREPSPKAGEESLQPVFLVSGLPRSGTSLMMQMLAAAGLDLYTDNNRKADESNPKGYFESELVKQLARNNSWLPQCRGKVVKIVSPLIPYLPQELSYKVIYMDRDMNEIIPSQTAMLSRLDKKGGEIEQRVLADAYSRHAGYAMNLLALYHHPVLRIQYAEVIASPAETAKKIAEFFHMDFNIKAMAAVVEPSLYRQKKLPSADS